jgi:predicted nucleic-acid-binding protein
VIGLDTNVFLRLFVEDNADQTARARRFVAAAVADEHCFVNAVVLAEFVWTLKRRMKREKSDIVRLIAQSLTADDLEFAHCECARRALAAYRSGDADFADYFLAEINRENGCVTTATFDRDALDAPTFSAVP